MNKALFSNQFWFQYINSGIAMGWGFLEYHIHRTTSQMLCIWVSFAPFVFSTISFCNFWIFIFFNFSNNEFRKSNLFNSDTFTPSSWLLNKFFNLSIIFITLNIPFEFSQFVHVKIILVICKSYSIFKTITPPVLIRIVWYGFATLLVWIAENIITSNHFIFDAYSLWQVNLCQLGSCTFVENASIIS